MKSLVKSIAVSVLLILPWLSVSAGEQPSTKPQGQGSMQGMGQKGGMDMMGMSDEHMRAMQEDMLKMHDLMTRINAAKDPAERDRLKKQHLQMMKAHHAKMMQHRKMMMQHGKKNGMKMNSPSGQDPE